MINIRKSLIALFFCVIFISARTNAQNLCPAGKPSDKLVCVIPQVYGPSGLANGGALAAVGDHQGHFEDSFLNSLTPLNSEVGSQSSLLPLASPSSGITFAWNPITKAFAASTDDLGPILGERAETIGRYKLFLGSSYQYFKFENMDGVSLKNLPAVFTHQDDGDCSISGPNPGPSNTNSCGFVRDVIATNTGVDLKVHQFTTFITFGLTNRIDVSAVIPIENVRMGVSSKATIMDNSDSGDHVFPTTADCPAPCLNKSFSSSRTASGIGDITLRVKGTAWRGERAAVALGVDVRVPTGDKLNFLGSGAAGVRPFVVWSYRSRISPHIVVGYETNGSSVLAGDTSSGSKDRLPSQLTYAVGADARITKSFTVAFDLVGQQVFQARRIVIDPNFHDLGPCVPFDITMSPYCTSAGPAKTYSNVTQVTGSYNNSNASIGLKFRPTAGLLITGNVLVRLNEGGLRADYVPLVGVSYTF